MTTTKFKWNSEHINHLYHSMKGFRPYGLDKHFQMMFILEKFRARTGLNVTADVLWNYITEELYDIKYLTEREIKEFKNKKRAVEYTLPPDIKS